MSVDGGGLVSFGATDAVALRQSILCVLEISRSGRTATMLAVITGRARQDVRATLGAMERAGEVALEEGGESVLARITHSGSARLREEIGGMMVLTRVLVEDAWKAPGNGVGDAAGGALGEGDGR